MTRLARSGYEIYNSLNMNPGFQIQLGLLEVLEIFLSGRLEIRKT
jgi:hypothetical protein